MAIQNEETTSSTFTKVMKRKYLEGRRSGRMVSFSAKLPEDVVASFQDCCVCAVKYTTSPLSEIRESIVEMIQKMGIRDWKEMEELIYCYVALNSTDVHTFIHQAFLTLC